MMLRDLVWFAVIIMSINATLAVVSYNTDPEGSFASSAFGSGGVLNWVPQNQQYSLDSNFVGTSALIPSSSPSGIIGGTVRSIFAAVGLESVFDKVLEVSAVIPSFFNLLVILVAGMIIFMNEIGLPSYVVFLFGVPATIINIAGIIILIEHIVSIIRGVLPV